jgi:hypothetical protein
MHSALIDRVQKAMPIVFNLSPKVFKSSYKQEKVPELAQLSKFDPSSKCLAALPPVLFPIKVQEKGREGYETKLFQGPKLFWVSR